MPRYFYILDYVMNPQTHTLDKLTGYFTDEQHRTRGAAQTLTRTDALRLLAGEHVLFLLDGCYRRVHLKLVQVEHGAFIRVDHFAHRSDYLG